MTQRASMEGTARRPQKMDSQMTLPWRHQRKFVTSASTHDADEFPGSHPPHLSGPSFRVVCSDLQFFGEIRNRTRLFSPPDSLPVPCSSTQTGPTGPTSSCDKRVAVRPPPASRFCVLSCKAHAPRDSRIQGYPSALFYILDGYPTPHKNIESRDAGYMLYSSVRP